MGTERTNHAVAVVDGKLYAVGGMTYYNDWDEPYVSTLRSVERYDPAMNVWEEVGPMGTERTDHAVSVVDGKLYAVGGTLTAWLPWTPHVRRRFDGDGFLSSLERYDPATNVWEAVAAPMGTARLFPLAVCLLK